MLAKPRRRTDRGKMARTYLGVAIILIWGLAPFYWMVVTAFRQVDHTFDTTPWPTYLTLDNFRAALSTDKGNDFLGAIVNSLIIGVVTTAVGLLLGVFASYALARIEFRGKYIVTGIILGASMFPTVALMTPLFQLFGDFGWIGQYQALIIPNISFVLPLTIYTLTSFLSDLPWELEEAARIDGASRFQAFRLVILPLAAPGAVHDRDPRVHRDVERVHAREPAVDGEDRACHGRDRALRGRQLVGAAVRGDHGGRHDRDDPAGDHGAGVPAPHRLRSHRGRREELR